MHSLLKIIDLRPLSLSNTQVIVSRSPERFPLRARQERYGIFARTEYPALATACVSASAPVTDMPVTGRHLERAGKASVGYSLRQRLSACNPALSVEVGLHFWVVDGSVVDSSIKLAENAYHTSGYVRMCQDTSGYVFC